MFERRGDMRRERDGCRIGPLQILEDEQCRTVDGRGHQRATGVDDRGEARAVLVGRRQRRGVGERAHIDAERVEHRREREERDL